MVGKHQQVSKFHLSLKTILVIIVLLFIAGKLAIWGSGSTDSKKTTNDTEDSSVSKVTPAKKAHSTHNTINYEPTQVIGPYSVSTKELNARPFYVDNQATLELQLNNQNGYGKVTFLDRTPSTSYTVYYQEIVTKTLKIKSSTGIRTVQVNTALVPTSTQYPVYFAFKNKSGLLSIAIPQNQKQVELYKEARQ